MPAHLQGIDHATCERARVAKTLWSRAEQALGHVLMKAFKLKVNVFVKVRVLDVIELDPAEPDRKRLFSFRDVLGDKHFDYVVCRRGVLEPPSRSSGTIRPFASDRPRKRI